MEQLHRNSNVANSTQEVSVEVRKLTPDDAEPYIDLLRQENERLSSVKSKLGLYALYQGNPEQLKAHLEQGENRNGIWVNGELAGGIDTTPSDKPGSEDVAYWVRKQDTRKGVGKAALKFITEQADERGVDLKAQVENYNLSSMAVLESNGFRERPLQERGQTDYLRKAKKASTNPAIAIHKQ